MKHVLKNSIVALLGVILLIFTACTVDDDSNNLYPEVTAAFGYEVDEEFTTVQFLNESVGGATYFWDFGNGTTSEDANPKVIYETFGEYTVTLTTTGPTGETASVSNQVIINEYFYPLQFPIDFEYVQNDYTFTNFGNAVAQRIANPDASGINTSDYVAEIIKSSGAETWAGTTLEIKDSIDVAKYNTIKVKTWSPKVGALVKLKIENAADEDIATETDAVTTVGNAWEELTFTFKDIDATAPYNKISIFFDFGNQGDGTTYYFDDLMLDYIEVIENPCVEETQSNAINPEAEPLAITFKDGETPLEMFGDLEEAVVANPLVDDVNNSCQVYQLSKLETSQVWGGTAIAGGLEGNIIPAEQSGVFKMKVLSQDRTANITLRLEFMAYPDVDPAAEVVAKTTKVGAWEELTFDFSEHTDKTFKSLVIYIDKDEAGDGSVFYFDDILQK